MKAKRTFFEWMARHYQLVVRSEEDLAEKSTFHFTYARLLIGLFVVFCLFMGLCLFLAKTLLSAWFDPQYTQAKMNKKLYEITTALDSLTMETDRRDKFIENLKYLLSNDTATRKARLPRAMEVEERPEINVGDMDLTPLDSQFRRDFEQSEISLLGGEKDTYSHLREIFFFAPVNGFIAKRYSPKEGRYGVEIITRASEPVKAVAEGIVVVSTRTQDEGYLLVVQHADNLVSVYKHNAEILKKNGSFVAAGSVLALADPGNREDGVPHLYFELWYDGRALDPEEFIIF